MIKLSEVKKNPQVLEFIKQTEKTLEVSGYTEHSLEHANLVAGRGREIAKEIGLSEKEQELVAIAGFCHDMGNFMTRDYHNYLTALLFHQLFKDSFSPEEISIIMQAISNHDREEMSFSNPVAAVLVLADKSDVRRSRVLDEDMEDIRADIHDRVNYATQESNIKVDKKAKRITLTLRIDSKFVPIMEYFEIFTDRMVYCRKAAKYLGYQFGLVINKFKLL
ncbi:MAG: HD domain-containing protein [Candidatus Nealsonbacteria bacterium]|nr:HD domain-containing protein [Candidatus Nealsonbacteria bacterium]